MTTKSDRAVPVAIVGGGASGTILAAQLARRAIKSVLIEGSGRMGRGVAYSTTQPAHLLNVRAEGMSAIAGEPAHFADWFSDRGGDSQGFAQRRLFADYLGEILEEAVSSGQTELVHATATRASHNDRWLISLSDGSTVEAIALVLAIGNQEPARLSAFSKTGPRYIANPWGRSANVAIEDLAETGGAALLVGTGLTMVDLVLSLEAAGHDGPIVAVSRRGQIPRSHADFEPVAVDADAVPAGDVRSLARWLRRRSGQVGWRAAVDSLRPHSHQLWQSLSNEQQRRFLRHGRPWWDVHRHRIAPEVAQMIAQQIAGGFLTVAAGRIVSAETRNDGVDVTIRRRGSEREETRRFAYVFNCTGPLQAIDRTKDPLLRGLLDDGAVQPDDLGMGVLVDGHSRAEGAERLWALGPLTKGRYWEIIAVPDIREQAAEVAEDIAKELAQ
nr:FAD/NAD(P)-binding protein [Sphingomonas hankyongi]